MKTTLIILILAFLFAPGGNTKAQQVAHVQATTYDISDNLDLEAVASIFADSKNLNDFERRLNNPKNEISNLDLNEDGYIDYLRVVEFSDRETRFITIQAVLGDDIYQDVATIELEKEGYRRYSMIIVGNHYIYGSDYFIRPIFVRNPTIFDFFFGPHYHPWHSPYYWGYYPRYYTYRAPCYVHVYREHIHHHINRHHHYEYLSHRNHAHDYYSKHSRNDYGMKHPDKAFEKRNEGAKNRLDLNHNRRSSEPNTQGTMAPGNATNQKPDINRRSGAVSRDKKSVDRPTQSGDVNRTNPNSKRLNEATPKRSKEVGLPTRNNEEKPAVREKRENANLKSQPKSTRREEAPKVNKSQAPRSAGNAGSPTRKSEGSVKKQAPEKKVEKTSAPQKKSSEEKSRR